MTKKTIISLCSAVVIAAGAAICVSNTKSNSKLENPFFKRNLEVLTSGESVNGTCTDYCRKNSSKICTVTFKNGDVKICVGYDKK